MLPLPIGPGAEPPMARYLGHAGVFVSKLIFAPGAPFRIVWLDLAN
ncbi:hypothetical protein [Trueperella bonasi]|nr:hypothetical protein [Trueperella bonasi]